DRVDADVQAGVRQEIVDGCHGCPPSALLDDSATVARCRGEASDVRSVAFSEDVPLRPWYVAIRRDSKDAATDETRNGGAVGAADTGDDGAGSWSEPPRFQGPRR